MERCCGLTCLGTRCRRKTRATVSSYGVAFTGCKFHRGQNFILEWSHRPELVDTPRDVQIYLDMYYALSKELIHMSNVSLVMLTTFVYLHVKEQDISDCYQRRLDFYEHIFKDGGSDECPICMDQKANVVTPCGHQFCKECVYTWGDVKGTCPMCREQFLKIFDT